MTKKRLFTAFISILMIFVIAGCSSSGDSSQNSAPANGNGNAGNGNGNRPAFQKPDIYGEVSAVSGNNVTLKLLKIPQMNRRNGQNGGNSGNGNGAGNGNGNANGNGNGGNMNGGNGGNGGQRRGGGFMRQKQYTGEVKTISIPSGVPLTTTTFGQNGPSQTNINLSDVAVGDVLSIYYNSDVKTIKNIRVQKPRTGNGGQGGNGAGNSGNNGNSGNGA